MDDPKRPKILQVECYPIYVQQLFPRSKRQSVPGHDFNFKLFFSNFHISKLFPSSNQRHTMLLRNSSSSQHVPLQFVNNALPFASHQQSYSHANN